MSLRLCCVFCLSINKLQKVVLLQADAHQKLPRLNDEVSKGLVVDETRTHRFSNRHIDRVLCVQLSISMEQYQHRALYYGKFWMILTRGHSGLLESPVPKGFV